MIWWLYRFQNTCGKTHLIVQSWSVHFIIYKFYPLLTKSVRLVESDILNLNPGSPLTKYQILDKLYNLTELQLHKYCGNNNNPHLTESWEASEVIYGE